jgi:hypothetical protein
VTRVKGCVRRPGEEEEEEEEENSTDFVSAAAGSLRLFIYSETRSRIPVFAGANYSQAGGWTTGIHVSLLAAAKVSLRRSPN